MKTGIRARLRLLRTDESGMALVYIAVGFMTFMAASTLAIDVGMFMTARSQAQNAADAGALAGAVALAKNSFTDRLPGGPAVQSAVTAAQANLVIGSAPSVEPKDVTFPNNPTTGQANRVRVNVYRTTARQSAIPTLIGPLFGVPTVDIGATATAEAAPANAMTCVKPFMIPDKWIENSDANGTLDGPWDPNSTFDLYDKKNKPLAKPDVYIGADHPDTYTGFSDTKDLGTRLTLRAGQGGNIVPSFYFSWKMPAGVGGDDYRQNIATCNHAVVHWDEQIIQEPGDMTGPTIQGIQDLIAQDPNARWDAVCNCVKGSAFGDHSPRVFPIPLYDPLFYTTGKMNGRDADFKVANFLGFFVEWAGGNQITGYVTKITGMIDDEGPTPGVSFPKAIRLVQ